MKNFGYTLLLLIAPSVTTSAQNFVHEIDSLKRKLVNARTDTIRMHIMENLAGLYFHRQMDSSIHYSEKALALARHLNDTEGETEGLFSVAYSLSDRDIPRSMALFYEVIERSHKSKIWNMERIAVSYQVIGALHLYLRNTRQSIDFKRKAQQIALGLKDAEFTSRIDMEIGEAFYIAGQLDSCRYYLTKADSENPPRQQSLYFQAYYLPNWGRAESVRNPKLALQYFQKSVRIAKASASLRILSLACRSLGDFYLQRNKPDSAILITREGLRASQQLNFYRGIYDNSVILAEAYKRTHTLDSAYHYQTIMVTARDSTFSFDKMNRIQTAIIDEQQRTQQVEAEKSQIKLYGLVGLIFGLFVLAGILYRNDRQKQKANALLQQQKQEIDTQRAKAETALTELRITQNQLIQKEKLASLGELTAGIAHEIQNPLNFVNNFSEVSAELVDELKAGPLKKLPQSEKDYADEILGDLTQNLQKITLHGGRASSIVKGMLEHSRTSTGERQPTDLNALADEYLRLAYHGLRAKDKTFNGELVTDFAPDLGKVEVGPQEIGRVLLNLYTNAFYAVQQKQMIALAEYRPTIWVSTRLIPHTSPEGVVSIANPNGVGGFIEIQVRDNGTGIAEGVKAKIFQPFFTTKPTGEGTGLGLSLSYDIITKGHGGNLSVESVEGEGTTFVITMPNLVTG